MNNNKRSSDYLQHNNRALGLLATKLEQIKHWKTILASSIPKEDQQLLQHCHVIHVDSSSLTIIVDSPHWATRLRFLTPKLIAQLKKHPDFKHISTIRHKISPPASIRHLLNAYKLKKPMTISKKTSDLLEKTAQKIQHASLRSILMKMAQQGQKKE